MPLERPFAPQDPREDPPEDPRFWRGPAGNGSGPGSRADIRSPRSRLLRRFAILVAVAAVLWLVVMLVGGDAGALAIFRAGSHLADLERQVQELSSENARLRVEIRRLRSDDAAIERIAREQLMMGRPGEEVLLVPDPRALPEPTPTPKSKSGKTR